MLAYEFFLLVRYRFQVVEQIGQAAFAAHVRNPEFLELRGIFYVESADLLRYLFNFLFHKLQRY